MLCKYLKLINYITFKQNIFKTLEFKVSKQTTKNKIFHRAYADITLKLH